MLLLRCHQAKIIEETLCEHHERVVGKDNCVCFDGLRLQITRQTYRMNFVKLRVKVHRYIDRSLAVFYGPRLLARYNPDGQLLKKIIKQLQPNEQGWEDRFGLRLTPCLAGKAGGYIHNYCHTA